MLETKPGETIFNAVEQLPLSQHVVASIREAILSGKLQPGQQLIEAELAEAMKVSRAPIREALRHLEEESLIQRIPYKGAFVAQLTAQDIRELYSLRSAIEAFSARLAAEHATVADVATLEDILNRMQQAAQAKDQESVTALDLTFHRAVCQIAQHKLLLQVWNSLEQKVRLILSLRHRLHRDFRDVIPMHVPLLDAIRAHDGEAAARAMMEHIVTSGEFIVRDWAAMEGERE